MTSYRRAFILLADGARYDVMHDLLKQGLLPNIEASLASGGSFLKAATCFPSTTGPAYLPFLTGCLPGTCNVPGIRWVDRKNFSKAPFLGHRSYVGLESFLMGMDTRSDVKTVFQTIKRSYSIFNPAAKGSGRRNLTRYSRIWHWYYAHMTDHWAACDEAALDILIGMLKKDPEFVFAVFPGIDEYSHLSHPRHVKVLERYAWLDQAIGNFVAELERRNMKSDSAIFLVSDHGLSHTHTHCCLNYFLEKNGFSPFFYPRIFGRRKKNCANMISGNGMTHLYFKGDGGWKQNFYRDDFAKHAPDLLQGLVSLPAVDLVCVRDYGGWICVTSKLGSARMKLEDKTIHYEVLDADPFGYDNLSGSFSDRQCLKETISTRYPDAPFQITHLFASPRCGDVVVSAAVGFDLRDKYENPEHKSSHGSLSTEHMLVPVVTNVPLPRVPIRTVDVYPTILSLLGSGLPQIIDGLPIMG